MRPWALHPLRKDTVGGRPSPSRHAQPDVELHDSQDAGGVAEQSESTPLEQRTSRERAPDPHELLQELQGPACRRSRGQGCATHVCELPGTSRPSHPWLPSQEGRLWSKQTRDSTHGLPEAVKGQVRACFKSCCGNAGQPSCKRDRSHSEKQCVCNPSAKTTSDQQAEGAGLQHISPSSE